MAIITKIRERAGLAVGIVALALGLFVVGGDILSSNSILLGNNKQIVGEIDGEDIPLQLFSNEAEIIKDNFSLRSGSPISESQMPYVRELAWQELVYRTAWQKEYDKLGLKVIEDELTDMVQGNNIHPAIAGMFGAQDPATIDLKLVRNFLANIDQYDPRFKAMYLYTESKLIPERLRAKYQFLLEGTNYVTNAEAKRQYEAENSKADIRYVYVPYASVPDSAIKIEDAQLSAHYGTIKTRFDRKASRSIEYLTFPVQATAEDEAAIAQGLADLKNDFAATTNDSAFVEANSDTKNNFLSTNPSGLPAQVQPSELETGKVFGPFKTGNTYKLYKVLKIEDDSVEYAKAAHILFGKDEAAKKKAQEVLAQIKGGEDFGKMADQYGTDGTKGRGGDLGWFDKTRMVKPFADAVFSSGNGLVPRIVETEFGYHLVRVDARLKKKYTLASIEKEVSPSDETVETAYRKAAQFTTAQNRDELQKLMKEKDSTLILYQSLDLAPDAFYINNITGPKVRQVLTWAFNEDREVGDRSEVFDLDDQYLVVLLMNKKEEGIAPLEDVKEEVKQDLLKKLKREQIATRLKAAATGSIEEIAAKYGPGAYSNTLNNLALSSYSTDREGESPRAIGRAFALKAGERSDLIEDENGIFLLEAIKVENAVDVADYASYKKKLSDTRKTNTYSKINQALNKYYGVKNESYRYY